MSSWQRIGNESRVQDNTWQGDRAKWMISVMVHVPEKIGVVLIVKMEHRPTTRKKQVRHM